MHSEHDMTRYCHFLYYGSCGHNITFLSHFVKIFHLPCISSTWMNQKTNKMYQLSNVMLRVKENSALVIHCNANSYTTQMQITPS